MNASICTHPHLLGRKGLRSLFATFLPFLLGLPWGLDCFRRHRIGGSRAFFFSFLVRWENSRNYGVDFEGRIDIENPATVEVFELLDWQVRESGG